METVVCASLAVRRRLLVATPSITNHACARPILPGLLGERDLSQTAAWRPSSWLRSRARSSLMAQ